MAGWMPDLRPGAETGFLFWVYLVSLFQHLVSFPISFCQKNRVESPDSSLIGSSRLDNWVHMRK